MSAASVYAKLRKSGGPLIRTAEAAAPLRTSTSSASRALRTLSERGLATRVRHGLWSLAPERQDPRLLAPEITRPYPSYVSFDSALAAHGAIDQIPQAIALASTGRPKRVKTNDATFAVHRLPVELFGGFEDRDGVALAKPATALFAHPYVHQASARGRPRLPEPDLPAPSPRQALERRVARIPPKRHVT